MKILIIRFSSIGDIVLTTPVVRCLKQQLQAEVHYCTKPQFSSIVEENPYIDKVITLDTKLNQLVSTLRKEQYDYVIDLHKNLRTRIIKAGLKAKSFSFNKLNRAKWLMVNFKINMLPNVHIADRYMETVKPLGCINDEKGLDYFIPEKDEVDMNVLPEPYRNEYVVYAIGAQHYTKKLPLKRMIELCDKINKPIVLLGDKNDKATGEQIERFFQRSTETAHLEPKLWEMNKKARVYNACGLFNLNQSASLIKNANFVFTHDTGLMHIASAFKKNIFSIWGNTIPEFGMYPYKTKFTILERDNLNCRPCSKIGFQKCPKGHFKCMNEIAFDFYIP